MDYICLNADGCASKKSNMASVVSDTISCSAEVIQAPPALDTPLTPAKGDWWGFTR